MKKQNLKYKKKRQAFIKFCLFALYFLFLAFKTVAQDSIPVAKDITEEKDLEFQEFFFSALSHKAVGNFQKAIENLEACNQIQPKNTTVFFEFSKNYFALQKNFLAKEYINKALKQAPKNIWMLIHLTKILKKERNFSEAIQVQKKIIDINPKKREDLVRLFILNKEYKNAALLLQKLADKQLLTSKLRYLKTTLEQRNSRNKKTKQNKIITTNNLFEQFENSKKYETLEKILKEHKGNFSILQKYSKIGMDLFPAQPFVYWVSANALIQQKKYKEAVFVLENGIDFVIDENMERQFYKTFIEAYKGLGNLKKEEEFSVKLKKLTN